MKIKKFRVMGIVFLIMVLAAGACAGSEAEGPETEKPRKEQQKDTDRDTDKDNDASPTALPEKDTPTGEPGREEPTHTPAPTDMPALEPTPVMPARGQIVTAIYAGERHDFEFSEDYELFQRDKDFQWTLDLNGNTVTIDNTVEISSLCTISNGTLKVVCNTGFRSAQPVKENSSWNVRFSGEEIGPLKIIVSDGACGIEFNKAILMDTVEMEIYGIGMTTSRAGSEGKNYCGEMRNCTVNVVGGAGLYVSKDSGKVSFRYGSNNVFRVSAGGVGIDVFGTVSSDVALCDKLYVEDGYGVRVQKEADYSVKYPNLISVENGVALFNEGRLNYTGTVSVIEGTALLNLGYCEIGSNASFLTNMNHIFEGTLIYNATGASMAVSGSRAYCFAAQNAVGVENCGTMLGNWHLFGGFQVNEDRYAYQLNQDVDNFRDELLPENTVYSESFNVFENTKLFVLKKTSITKIDELYVFLNANDSGTTGAANGSVALYNECDREVECGDVIVDLRGKGAIGIANMRGGVLTENADSYRQEYTVSMAKPGTGYSAFDATLAEYKAGKYTAENCVGIYNAGKILNIKDIRVTAAGVGSVGIHNSGDILLEEGSKKAFRIEIAVTGKKIKGFYNDGTLLGDTQYSYDKLNISVYGEECVGLENKDTLVLYECNASAEGEKCTAVMNNGSLIVTNEQSIRLVLRELPEVKKSIGFENNGEFRADRLNLQMYTYSSDEDQKKINETTGLLNKESGTITVNKIDGKQVGKMNCLINNRGQIQGKKMELYSLDESVECYGLNNTGKVEVETLLVEQLGGGERTSLVNASEIMTISLRIVAAKQYENATFLENTGTIECQEGLYLTGEGNGNTYLDNSGTLKASYLQYLAGENAQVVVNKGDMELARFDCKAEKNGKVLMNSGNLTIGMLRVNYSSGKNGKIFAEVGNLNVTGYEFLNEDTNKRSNQLDLSY